MRVSAALLVLAVGCARNGQPHTAPGNPGVTGADSTTYEGATFVPAAGDLSFVDVASGSRFNLMGQAYEGPLAEDAVQLRILPAMTAFWFAWSVHYPGARVWPDAVNNAGHTIESGPGCGVPCDELIQGCFGGRDCIPSNDEPHWTTAGDTPRLGYLADDDRVLGLYDGVNARAYPLDALWTHEIVNDGIADRTFSVTYCPLTGSGILVEGVQDGTPMRFGVSGLLYNSNLVLYDRTTDSLYGQMRQVGFKGDNLGLPLATAPVVDTTWGTWRAMFPDTAVLSDRNGISGYPYGDYRTDDADTFMRTNPPPDPRYAAKDYAIGVTVGDETVIYAFPEIEARVGKVGIVTDTVGDEPVVLAYDGRSQTAVVFSARIAGEPATFEVGGD